MTVPLVRAEVLVVELMEEPREKRWVTSLSLDSGSGRTNSHRSGKGQRQASKEKHTGRKTAIKEVLWKKKNEFPFKAAVLIKTCLHEQGYTLFDKLIQGRLYSKKPGLHRIPGRLNHTVTLYS